MSYTRTPDKNKKAKDHPQSGIHKSTHSPQLEDLKRSYPKKARSYPCCECKLISKIIPRPIRSAALCNAYCCTVAPMKNSILTWCILYDRIITATALLPSVLARYLPTRQESIKTQASIQRRWHGTQGTRLLHHPSTPSRMQVERGYSRKFTTQSTIILGNNAGPVHIFFPTCVLYELAAAVAVAVEKNTGGECGQWAAKSCCGHTITAEN